MLRSFIKEWSDYHTLVLWCFPHSARMLVCIIWSEYETSHTNFLLPKKKNIFCKTLCYAYTFFFENKKTFSTGYSLK